MKKENLKQSTNAQKQEGGPLTDPAQEEKKEALFGLFRDIEGAADVLHYVIKDIDIECNVKRANALITVNDILYNLCNKGYNMLKQDLGSLPAEGGQA